MICEKHCIYLRAHSKNTGHMKMKPEFVKAKGKKKHLLSQTLAWTALQFSVNDSEHSSHEYTV